MAEVIKTEETYVTDLRTIVDVYQKPIHKRDLMNARQLGTIFGNSTLFVILLYFIVFYCCIAPDQVAHILKTFKNLYKK